MLGRTHTRRLVLWSAGSGHLVRDTDRIRMDKLQYEFGKARLRPEAVPVLDAVGDLLSNWPDLKIEVGGHTDSKGSKKLIFFFQAEDGIRDWSVTGVQTCAL